MLQECLLRLKYFDYGQDELMPLYTLNWYWKRVWVHIYHLEKASCNYICSLFKEITGACSAISFIILLTLVLKSVRTWKLYLKRPVVYRVVIYCVKLFSEIGSLCVNVPIVYYSTIANCQMKNTHLLNNDAVSISVA